MSQTRLFKNPAVDATDDTRVWANLDPTVHTYFFRKTLAGCTGAKQAIINIFFKRFYEECLAQGITPEWSLENEIAILEVLKRLNFDGPTRTRRTNNTAPKRKSKPILGHNVAGGTYGIRKEAPELRDVGTNTVSKT